MSGCHLQSSILFGYLVFQVIPPVPKRGIPLGLSLRGSLPATTSHPSETQTDPNRSERLRGNTNPVLMSDRDSSTNTDTSNPGDLYPPGIMYSELIQVENRNRSLLRLKNNMEEEEEEEYSNRLSSPSFTSSSSSSSYSPTPLKRVTCHTYSLHDPRLGSSRSEQQADEILRSNPLYQTAEGPGGRSAQQGGGTYAEVPQRPTPTGLPDDTYEQIPGVAVQGNTYESLEEMKTKKSTSTWGKNVSQKERSEVLMLSRADQFHLTVFLFCSQNMKWKKFLPDYKKK